VTRGDDERLLPDEDATLAFGACLAGALGGGAVLYLHGELGAGKTTLARGLLRALGHTATVKSPTYTLVEPYQVAGRPLYHFDLYRLADPEELEFLGIRDYLQPDAILLIEWPERGRGHLPAPDLEIRLAPHDGGRRVRWHACSERGAEIVARLGGGGGWAQAGSVAILREE
jgi:tRNA threonylcarbamoyladenosine biosynthesis protein TsaE